MKNRIALLAICMISMTSWGQDQKERNRTGITFGIEQDVLPYILKGGILTVWVGKDNFRIRSSYAKAINPKFMLGDKIESDQVNAFGMSFEYFFKDNLEGLWLGPGIGIWNNTVEFEPSAGMPDYSLLRESFIFSFGGGYNFRLTNWLYVSPWVALHSRVSKTESNEGDFYVYNPSTFTPEVSFKIGIKFPTQKKK